jgi:hypothetical protein
MERSFHHPHAFIGGEAHAGVFEGGHMVLIEAISGFH